MTTRSSTTWMSLVGSVASIALAACAIGCGPAPGYEYEARVPSGYNPQPARTMPTPATNEELQAQAEARGEVAIGENQDEYADTDPSALTEFKPALDGHGTWVDDATYGTVWVPAAAEVGTDFEPYVTEGHWTYDEDQSWVWVSNYEWGWAPFHYGRWTRLPHHGWSWIPGRTYAGAWVVWRTGPVGYDYIGWTAAPPEWYWSGGYAYGWGFGYYQSPYWYCHHDYIYDSGWRGHAVYGGTPGGQVIDGRTSPYRPAAPPARVAATPVVNGPSRVVAQPRVNAGPRPNDVGIKPTAVVAPPSGDARLARARALATPATARPFGAAAPVASRPRRIDSEPMLGNPNPNREIARSGVERTSPSVATRLEPAARAPQVAQPTPGRPTTFGSQGFAGRVAQPSTTISSQPAYTAPPSYSPPAVARVAPVARPTIDPTPRYTPSAPSVRQPSVSSTPSVVAQPSAPVFRPQPSVQAPTFRPQPSVSAPTFRSQPSAPIQRSAPSVAAPSVVSRPSTPTFRSAPSAPSRPSTPSVRSSGGRRR